MIEKIINNIRRNTSGNDHMTNTDKKGSLNSVGNSEPMRKFTRTVLWYSVMRESGKYIKYSCT